MWKFAIRNLLSRPMRSLLSLLGLTVAILGMVGLFSIAHGLDQQLTRTFNQIPGLAAMQPGAPIPLFSTLPAAWREEIAAVEGVSVVTSEIWQRVNVINEKMIVSPPRFLFGFDIAHSVDLERDVYGDSVTAGRHLTLADQGTFNCLISKQIAEEYKVGVGDSLTVNGSDLTIVGIYECGSMLLDLAVVMDIEQVRGMTRFDEESVTSFYIEPKPDADKEQLAERITDVFRDRKLPAWTPAALGLGGTTGQNPLQNGFSALDRWLKDLNPNATPVPPSAHSTGNSPASAPSSAPRDSSSESQPAPANSFLKVDKNLPIEVRTAQEWGKRYDKFTDDLDVILTILTGIGVTIAVLSIVNTMVMSVTERIIEFGILKANGWSRSDVLKLITFESGLLGLGGGVLGSLLGWAGTLVVNWNWPTRFDLYAGPGLLTFSVVFAVALGILGGLYPATWAMRMMPMDAIRRG